MKPLSKGSTVKAKPITKMTEKELNDYLDTGTPITREELNRELLESRERKKKKGK